MICTNHSQQFFHPAATLAAAQGDARAAYAARGPRRAEQGRLSDALALPPNDPHPSDERVGRGGAFGRIQSKAALHALAQWAVKKIDS